MKVVVDTNVLLSSLLSSPTGTLNRLLNRIHASHTLILSLAVELGAVIVRPKFAHLDTEKNRVAIAQSLLSAPHIIAIVPTFTITHPDLPDVDDNRLLEVAVASHADLIVSGGKELLALRQIARSEAIEGGTTSSSSPAISILSAANALDFLPSI